MAPASPLITVLADYAPAGPQDNTYVNLTLTLENGTNVSNDDYVLNSRVTFSYGQWK